MERSCTTYYLEMVSASELKEKPQPHELQIIECEVPQAEFNRFLYKLVGTPWEWGDLDTWGFLTGRHSSNRIATVPGLPITVVR